jgi:DNA-binding NtrC family response regulator
MSDSAQPLNNNPRLLLVEDDEFVRNATKKILELKGFIITAVEHGIEAIQSFRSDKFDLALIDINIPGGGGIDVYKQIRSKKVDFPIVLISGDLDLEEFIEFKKDRYFSFIHKPYDPIQMVNHLLSVSRNQL